MASVFVTPEPLNHVEGAKLESTLSRFTLDSKEYRFIGESGSVKSGKHYAMDTNHEHPLEAYFSDWPQAAVTHFGILVSPCMVRIQSPDDRPSTRNDTRSLVCSPTKQHRFPVRAEHAAKAIVIALRCSRSEPALQRSEVGVDNRIAASGGSMKRVLILAAMIAPRPLSMPAQAPEECKESIETVPIETGNVGVDWNRPHRPVPVDRIAPRETSIECCLRTLNPKQIRWPDGIEWRIARLSERSLLNPYLRWSGFQMGVILFLLLVCWVWWWDKMRQIKRVAAECLADALNAERITEYGAKEAIGPYNRHTEYCNRLIDDQESGLTVANSTDTWRQKSLNLRNSLAAEETKSMRLQEALEDWKSLQTGLEQRLRQLEALVLVRPNGANAELVARLRRAKSHPGDKKVTKRGPK